ncbi:response regulator [Candidatus Woesearchaeota archaeon]|nr:response regulator [Candidatus Woesearchaeota archaeon]
MILKVLIVEDSDDDAQLLVHELRKSFSVTTKRVWTAKDMSDALAEKWDVVISDYYMPRFSGLEALNVLKKSGMDIPFIIVSGKIGEETAVEAMNSGVHDYIIKDNMARLAPAIKRELEEAAIREKHRESDEKLRKYREHLENLVRLRTSELTESNEKLKAELVEKETLLKEIHHRVKNNLQIILSLLHLARGIGSRNCGQVLEESENRIKAMALVHEALYKSENLSSLDMSAYVRAVTDNLMRSYRIQGCDVSILLDIDNFPISIDTAIPCGLIINELVSNSLKHAFSGRKKGTITVSVKADDALVRMVVKDDGAGFPKGIDYSKTESLGLQLVNSLASQISASLEADTTKGTNFTMTFRR